MATVSKINNVRAIVTRTYIAGAYRVSPAPPRKTQGQLKPQNK